MSIARCKICGWRGNGACPEHGEFSMVYDQIPDPPEKDSILGAQQNLREKAGDLKSVVKRELGLQDTATYYRAAWTPKGLVHPKCAGEWASYGRYGGKPLQTCAKCGERLEVAT
ncbi:MAG: hypothetical protein V3W37_03055 [Candidatus Binatia bacterium]